MNAKQYHVRFRLPYDATDLEDRETIIRSTFEPTPNRIRHWCPQLRNADILEVTPIQSNEFAECGAGVPLQSR